jgi:hypothetical protein
MAQPGRSCVGNIVSTLSESPVDGGVNPRKSGSVQKVGTKIAVELFGARPASYPAGVSAALARSAACGY